ncbi:conserved hypothetical protein [[Acidovorax] ebreus TPSY]|uniref:Uncharacterized protein n=2 Tax=Comamonadaceae TaxID=80864 RepID=A0A9J9UBM0_ACIET|nr:conserved hypothetical protein [[Acidovorax] ebreus TPSY]
MLREELVLNVDWAEAVALFNADARHPYGAVVLPGMRKVVHAATKAVNGESR